jgi:hypothetical protein
VHTDTSDSFSVVSILSRTLCTGTSFDTYFLNNVILYWTKCTKRAKQSHYEFQSNRGLCLLVRYLTRRDLTPRIRILFEKLTVTQLVKKFPAFYDIRRFITVVTKARYWSLSCTRSIHCTYSLTFGFLCPPVCAKVCCAVFPPPPSRFSTKILHAFLPCVLHAPPISLIDLIITICYKPVQLK